VADAVEGAGVDGVLTPLPDLLAALEGSVADRQVPSSTNSSCRVSARPTSTRGAYGQPRVGAAWKASLTPDR
jgi:hypothetical protein